VRTQAGAVGLLLAAIAACAPTSAPPAAQAETTTTRAAAVEERQTAEERAGEVAVVASITDGDTFRTTSGERVRLIGIDTPEVSGDECFASEATAALAALIPPGSEVRLITDVEGRDRFGRLLAYVERVPDGAFVNRELAVGGFAVQLTVPPNVARADDLGAAVAEARDAGRGLWSGCSATTTAPPPPPTPAPTPAPPPLPVVPPATTGTPPPSPVGACDPSYPDVCIPPGPPDLDCGEIPHRRFRVVGVDPHGFDGDRDGVGCEST
jgi:micrococcal nuclease